MSTGTWALRFPPLHVLIDQGARRMNSSLNASMHGMSLLYIKYIKAHPSDLELAVTW